MLWVDLLAIRQGANDTEPGAALRTSGVSIAR